MNAKFIYVLAFLDLLAISLIIPLLSPHIRSLGISHSVAGLISSLYSGLQLISGPVIGSWSDARGRRSIMLLTLLVCSLCYVSIGRATSITFILVGRIGVGIFKHTQTLCRALISDLFPSASQAKAYGTISAISGAGFILGPIIGGHMMEYNNGFQNVCFLVACIFCTNAGIVYLFVPDDKQPAASVAMPTISIRLEISQAVKELSKIDWPHYWDIFTLKFLLGFTMSIFFAEYSLSIQDKFQLTPKLVGYTISFQGLVGSTFGISIGYIERFFYNHDTNRNFQILHGFIVLTISLVCLSFAPNLPLFIICLVPLSACCSLLRIMSTETMLDRTASDKKGTIIGTGGSVVSVARLVAPVFAGLVRDMFGVGGISTLTVASATLGTCIAGVILIHHTKEKAQ